MIGRLKLGDLMLSKGLITEEDLDSAIKYHKSKSIRIDKALVELGYISDVKLLALLSEHFNLPTKTLNEIQPRSGVFDIVSPSMVKEYRIFPFDFDDTTLSIVLEDTVNLIMLDEVKNLLGRDLKVFLIREVDFEKLIDMHLNQTKILADLKDLDVMERGSTAFDLSIETENSPVSKAVNSYLRQGYLTNASDIHFDITDKEMLVRYRIDGELITAQIIPQSSANFIVARLKLMAELNTTETRIPQDGSMQISVNKRVIDLRISVVPALYGEKVVIRILDNDKNIRDLDSVGFNPQNLDKLKQIIKHPFGLILVTGPTGSGKSTLLYTFIHELLDNKRNIIAIEDPVEYKLPSITQMTVNLSTGLTFPVGLRAILRQDPDIILVGEIRDELTAEIAVKASNTGHLVFSTLHTNSAVSSITRLFELGVEPYLVSGAVLGVVNQRLVRRLCPDCKQEHTVKSENDKDLQFFGLTQEKEYKLYKPVGCTRCNHLGYTGRIPIHEVLIVDEGIREMLSERRPIRDIEKKAIDTGMLSLNQDGVIKALEGVTTLSEIRKYVV